MKRIREMLRRRTGCHEEREGCAIASEEQVNALLEELDKGIRLMRESSQQRATFKRWDAMRDRRVRLLELQVLELHAKRYGLTPDN